MLDVLYTLDVNKAVGPDAISNRMLLASEIKFLIFYVYYLVDPYMIKLSQSNGKLHVIYIIVSDV